MSNKIILLEHDMFQEHYVARTFFPRTQSESYKQGYRCFKDFISCETYIYNNNNGNAHSTIILTGVITEDKVQFNEYITRICKKRIMN